MKFSCEKALLLSAISAVSRTVSVKSAIPALEGILVEAQDQLLLTGYNMETGIRTTVDAEITQPGSLVLPARLFGEIVRKLPDDVVVFQAESGSWMVDIRCGLSEFHILGLDPQDYPELPDVEQICGLSLPQETLRSMIAQTLFAVSDNESRPVHTGSLFDVDEMGLNVVSVDGFRLALRHEKPTETFGTLPFSFVVPGSALTEVERLCAGEAEVTIMQGDRHILFQTPTSTLICRRLEGEFLAYQKTIPRKNKIVVFADTRSLQQSIERVSLIINEKMKSPLRCQLGDGAFFFSTKTALGTASDKCPMEGDGKNLEIGFNHKFMLDALKAAGVDRLRLEFSSGLSPCVMLPAEGEENFLFMVLPVRLKAS